MLHRTTPPIAPVALTLTLALLFAACTGARGGAAAGAQDADTGSSDVAHPADAEADVTEGPLPLIATDGDALRPSLEGDLLALLTIDAGGTQCLSQPWNAECVARVRLLNVTDGSPIYSSTDVYAASVPLLEDQVLYWTGSDNRLRYHEVGGPGIVQPLLDHQDFYGIQAPVLVREGGVYWYAYDYGSGTSAFHRYDVSSGTVTRVHAAQHDWPWFMSELGAPIGPQFDVADEHVVWVHYQAYGDTWHYRLLRGAPGGDATPEPLPTGDVNCIWPRISGDWVYYLWFIQDQWECSQLKCIYHLSRVHLVTGEVEEIGDEDARITGLYPPLLWEGGAGWIDFRDGTYQVVLRPEGGEPVAVTPPERPVGLFSGVDLVSLDDGSLRVLWSTLFDGRLQIFAEDWDGR
ncbi:MAG: hypothetical protein ABIK09_10320 [Pseudomonadota bacterium]